MEIWKILWISWKNYNFLKKLQFSKKFKALTFLVYFPPQYFSSVGKGPKNHKKILAEPKRSTTECFNFFRNVLIIFRISQNNEFVMSWPIRSNMKNYEHFLFITFEVWENKGTLLLTVLAYFLRYGHFMNFTPIQQQKPILQCIFQNFDREREFCKNLYLFLILRVEPT